VNANRADLDFIEAAYAVADGQLDVVFCASPPGSSFVADVVRRNLVILVGLDDGHCRDIVNNRNPALRAGTIPQPSLSGAERADELQTITAHNYLICSDSIPTNDVYWLTLKISQYLDLKGVPNDTPYFLVHPGAELFHNGSVPGFVTLTRSSVQWFFGAIATFLTSVVVAALSGILWHRKVRDAVSKPEEARSDAQRLPVDPKKLEPNGHRHAGGDTADVMQIASDMLRDSVEQLVDDVIAKPVLTDAERDIFRQRYRELRDRVLASGTQEAADSPTMLYLAVAQKLIERGPDTAPVEAEPTAGSATL
jgi:hypothetical protein